MKRTPLVRRTPLRSTCGIVRGRPLRLSRPRMPAGLREAVYARAGGRCDCCGQALSPSRWECHHRLLRSRGGRDEAANLVALRPSCHERAHGKPRWATGLGLILPSGSDPAACAVWRHGLRWQLPGEGQWRAAETPRWAA